MSKCFFALMMMFTLAVMPASACTNLIVGKKASADGSVMCTYNCDGFGFSGSLFYSPAGRHAPGEKIAIHGWGPTHEGRYVDQVGYIPWKSARTRACPPPPSLPPETAWAAK